MVRQYDRTTTSAFELVSSTPPPDPARAAQVREERIRWQADADLLDATVRALEPADVGQWVAACDGVVVCAPDFHELFRKCGELGLAPARAVRRFVYPSTACAPE